MPRSDDIPRAAAVRFDRDAGEVPTVVAAGMGPAARRILQIAEDCGIPVYEDQSLATLLSQCEASTRVPPSLIDCVSQIFSEILRMASDDEPADREEDA